MKFHYELFTKWTTIRIVQLMTVLLILSTCKQAAGKLSKNATTKYVSSTTPLKSATICTHIKQMSPKQMRFCEKYKALMGSIFEGIQLGIKECKYQFRKRRWNCTSLISKPPMYRNHAVSGTKEDAFTHAIIAAGIAHSVAKALNSRNFTLPGENYDTKNSIKNGIEIAKEFLDGQNFKNQEVKLMNQHNTEVGLAVVNNSSVMECKCIGASKSCNVRTCWKRLPSFRTVGKVLHAMYVKSVKVKSNQAQSSLVLLGDPFSKPTRKTELVHIRDSPNYCDRKASLGILGTQGRTCVKDSEDKEADVCDIMCCGRGYDTRIVMRKWKCHCKFYWCCFVKCKLCSEEAIVQTCK